MTKKDYLLIANAIKVLSPRAEVPSVVQALARAFAGTNPLFNYARFVQACEKDES